ncbi:MAG: hypothetical protein R2744_11220 [Bacteroidales bacterium]
MTRTSHNRIILNVWKREQESRSILIRSGSPNRFSLNHLRENSSITYSRFRKIASISGARAERILVDFILLGILDYDLTEKAVTLSRAKSLNCFI